MFRRMNERNSRACDHGVLSFREARKKSFQSWAPYVPSRVLALYVPSSPPTSRSRPARAGLGGAPTFGVGGGLFWGQDRLDVVIAALGGWRPDCESAQ